MARRKKEEAAAPLKWENVPEIPKEEQPYPLPEGWKWVRLGDVYQINPKVVADDNVLASFVPMDKISPDMSGSFTYDIHEWGKIKKGHTQFADGDVAFAKISPCFENGKKMLVRGLKNGIGAGTTELIILRSKNILQKFTIYLLSSDEFINKGVKTYSGTVGQQRINMGWVRSYPIPLPPVKIQERIVTCIESLFSKLDEAAEKIQAVIDSHEARKQAILHQAFSGELTRNIEIKDEGPLKDIPEIPKDEQPYSLPKGWKWVRFGDVNDYKSKIINPINEKNKTFELYSVPSSANNYPEIVQGKDIGSPKQAVEVNDVLVCKINPRINRVWMVTGYTNNPLIASSEWIVFRNKNIDSNYIRLYFSSPLFREYMLSNVSGVGGSLMRAQPKFVKTYPLPLPPLKTQRRIADAVGSLFSQLDEAAEKVQAVIDSHEARKQAILHQAFSGS